MKIGKESQEEDIFKLVSEGMLLSEDRECIYSKKFKRLSTLGSAKGVTFKTGGSFELLRCVLNTVPSLRLFDLNQISFLCYGAIM